MPKPAHVSNVVCPFCGLICEDITLTVNGTSITAADTLPQYCRDCYQQASLTQTPDCRIGKTHASLDAALQKTAQLLNAASHPLFYGLAVDMNGARAAIQLAERCRGTIDHINSRYSLRNTRVMQDEGWIMATLSEIANRAEIIVILGAYPLLRFPRLIERLVPKHGGLFRQKDPEFVLLGPWRDTAVPNTLKAYRHRIIHTEPKQLDQRIRALSATLSAKSRSEEKSSSSEGAIPRLSRDLLQCRYSAIIWSAAEFTGDYPELSLETLSKTIKAFNRTIRCVAMPLGGSNGDTGFYHAATWQCGYQNRISFGEGFPHYDTVRADGRYLLENDKTDLLIWISPLDPSPPPETQQSTVAIAHPKMPLSESVDVFIPAGIPGVDHAGHMFRTDSIVSLPLRKVRDSSLQPAAVILKQLLGQVHTHAD